MEESEMLWQIEEDGHKLTIGSKFMIAGFAPACGVFHGVVLEVLTRLRPGFSRLVIEVSDEDQAMRLSRRQRADLDRLGTQEQGN
jgi:hypothetical protein